ncbi:MAG: hypothetical protein WC506_07040 [Candidatus Micrarchaeia archaeon]
MQERPICDIEQKISAEERKQRLNWQHFDEIFTILHEMNENIAAITLRLNNIVKEINNAAN